MYAGSFKYGITVLVKAVRKLIKLAILGVIALSAAILSSVLFTGTVASGNLDCCDIGEGDYVLAWKPAYVFSIPEDGDLVVYDSQSNKAEGNRLRAAVYDSDEMDMASVRGKIIMKVPGKFASD